MRQIQEKAARLPLVYSIDEVARRYGIWPGDIDLHNPEHLRWVRRAWVFMSMESDKAVEMAKRAARRRG